MEVGRKPNPGNMRQDISSCSNGIVIYDTLKNEEPIRYRVEDVDNADDAYLDSFPPGFRFRPLDEELVHYYLKNKVMNLPLPRNRIMEVNLYSYNPEKLAEKHKHYGEMEWYFFTPRDKKYRNGTRPNRAAGDGFWKATGADREIRFNDRIIGYRKALVFYKGKPHRGGKSNWIMHEYRVNDPPLPRKERAGYSDMRLDDWVLCRIYKKPDKSGRTPSKTDVDAPVTQIPEETNGEMMVLDDNEMTDYNEYFNTVDQSLFQESWDNLEHIYDDYLSQYFPTTYLNEIEGEDNNLWINVGDVDHPTPLGLCVEPLVRVDSSTEDDNTNITNNNSYNNNNNNNLDKKFMYAKMDRGG